MMRLHLKLGLQVVDKASLMFHVTSEYILEWSYTHFMYSVPFGCVPAVFSVEWSGHLLGGNSMHLDDGCTYQPNILCCSSDKS